MSLIVSLENYKMSINDKSDLGGSDMSDGRAETEPNDDISILARPHILDKGSFMQQGFKVLPHSFLYSPIWKAARLKYRAFIIELLLRCCWKKTSFIINGKTIELLPGQFACSQRKIAELFNPEDLKGKARDDIFSRDDIRGAIQFFAYHRVLTHQIHHNYSVLTIIDKDIYDSNFILNPPPNPPPIPHQSPSHLNKPINQITKEEEEKEQKTAEAVEKPPKSQKNSTKQKIFDEKVHEITSRMLDCLKNAKNDYSPPKTLFAFMTHVDYILRIDKRDPEKLIKVFQWALSDSFWAAKMFKPNPAEYLRKQFDQFDMQMSSKFIDSKKVDRRRRDEFGNGIEDEFKDKLF